MAKVIKVFRERFENFKRYNVGDDYPETNKERVEYLISQGYLEVQGFEPIAVVSDDEKGKTGEANATLSETKKSKRRKRGADTDGDPDA